MPPHEFHQPDSSGHAPRLGVRAVEHAARFLDSGEKAKRARHKSHVVVDGLRHADDGERVAAAGRFLEKGVAAALGAISADGKEDVDAPRNQILDRGRNIHRSAR